MLLYSNISAKNTNVLLLFPFVRLYQEGKPLVLNVVRQAEQLLANDRYLLSLSRNLNSYFFLKPT